MGLLDIFKRKRGNIQASSLPQVGSVGFSGKLGKTPPKNQTQCVEEYKSWVYACTQKNAFSIASVGQKLFIRKETNKGPELEEIFVHPYFDLMRNVNPFMNTFELMSLTDIFLELTGDSYWWVIRDLLGVPREIWILPSHWMQVVPSKKEFIAGYVLRGPEMPQPIPFEEDEIIHFKFPSPMSLFYGAGPTQAAAYGVDLNNNSKKWAINFFENNANPDGILSTENSIQSDQFARLRDQWNLGHRGVKNAGRIAILSNGLKYQQTGSTFDKMNFRENEKVPRDEIFAMFGVPASKLGLVEDVNRANAEANDFTYQKETILPRLMLISEKINEKLIPMYDINLVQKFVNNVPKDKEFRLKEQTEHIRSGYSSIDDERTKDNEEIYDLPETSTPLISFSVVPAGSVESTNSEQNNDIKAIAKANYSKKSRKWEKFVAITAPHEKRFAKIMQRYFEAQHSEVMQKLNTYKSITKEGFDVSMILNINEQINKLKVVSEPSIRESYESGVTLGYEDLGIASFDLLDPNIKRAIDTRIQFFSTKVNETTVALLKGVEAGESIADISARVDKIFNFSEKFRSVRIAQTEIIGASNDGQLRSYLDAGVEQKEWVTARDEKVRDSHQIDGQVVDSTGTFTTNRNMRLLYPGDRSSGADAADVINCRCTILPVIKT